MDNIQIVQLSVFWGFVLFLILIPMLFTGLKYLIKGKEPTEFERNLAELIAKKSKINWSSQEISWEQKDGWHTLRDISGKGLLDGVEIYDYLTRQGIKLINKALDSRCRKHLLSTVKEV